MTSDWCNELVTLHQVFQRDYVKALHFILEAPDSLYIFVFSKVSIGIH